MQKRLRDIYVLRGLIGFALIVAILSPFESIAAQRGVVLIRDEAGHEVGLYRESHALLIGVSKYKTWPRLPGVRDDLRAVEKVLRGHGFNVEVFEDPDLYKLDAAYKSFIRKHGLNPENRLLFYFAGHGYTHKPAYATNDPEQWMGYIVARDAPMPEKGFGAFMDHAMSMQRFEELATQIEAKHALFIFDSCFSGSVFSITRAVPSAISKHTNKDVRQFITSGSADQQVPDASVFRRQFVTALEGEGDLTRDGYVTGTELGIFLEDKVTNYSKGSQTPQYGKIRHPRLDKGDYVFVLSKAGPEKFALFLEPTPPDARVQIMNIAEPYRPGILLQPGAYEIKVSKSGYKPYREWISVTNDDRRIQVTLESRHTVQAQKKTRTGHYTEPATGMEFVKVTGGCYEMGDTFGDGYSEEQPVHEVCLDDFYLGKYEVTQKQWQNVMGNNPSHFKGCSDCPVESVSWYDVQDFITNLNNRTGENFRLPTEAEWEYAARSGGMKEKWAGTNSDAALENYAWYKENSASKTHPVDQKYANGIGLYQMSGNVWEWVNDWFGVHYYFESPEKNPKGPSEGQEKILRGGCWFDRAALTRTSYRIRNNPSRRNNYNGFRLALSLQ